MPSRVVLATPPNSISRTPRLTSSLPRYPNVYNSRGGIQSYPKGALNIPRSPNFGKGIFTMDGGKEAADEVLVKAAVLAHLVDLLPFRVRHVLLDHLCTHLLTREVPTTKLQYDWSGS